ncbi:hypothetical protein HS041_12410 [Planomonospora sp. ID67723]|uniref:hypothetical protein n=1 Tax=Planomonospora sp. ID67723 TaxID=2738134 RepID=UPI0018C36CC9|nr:hypothetical protein [Planomonospora sp. ID67723]MBG0828572.1 hypothetical protein [Planomonospora sp. ID67723]
MTHYLIMDLGFVCKGPGDTDDAFDAFSDRVLDELIKLQMSGDVGIVGDPDITASLTERTMSILLGIEASTLQDADRLFMANVRCALHAAGCHTAGWPNYEPAENDFPPARKAEFAEA